MNIFNKQTDKDKEIKNHINSLNTVVAIEFIVFGFLYLLVGLDVIKISLKIFWLPVVVAFFGGVLVSIAILRRDLFAGWLSVPLLVVSITVIVTEATGVDYSKIYPLFVATPGIASLCVLPFTKAKRPHIMSAAFFVGIALVFLPEVIFGISWGIVIASLLIIIGTLLLINSLYEKGHNDWERNKEE